jgi:hypothetical protein
MAMLIDGRVGQEESVEEPHVFLPSSAAASIAQGTTILMPNAVSTSGEPSVRQQNVIMKYEPAEMELLLHLVLEATKKNPKKTVKWDDIFRLFSEEVKKNENSIEKGKCHRYPRDATQLRLAFQNRLAHKGAAEKVTQFDLAWKVLKSGAGSAKSAVQALEPSTDGPNYQSAAEAESAAETTSDSSGAPQASLQQSKESSNAPTILSFSTALALESAPRPSLAVSQSPAPTMPTGERKRQREEVVIAQPELSQLMEQYQTADGGTDWVKLLAAHPDAEVPWWYSAELEHRDKSSSRKSQVFMNAEDPKEVELASLRGGKLIYHTIIMRCLEALAPSSAYVVPYAVVHCDRSSSRFSSGFDRLPHDRTLLFLLFYQSHFISAATRPTEGGKKLTLCWWDSIRAHCPAERKALLARVEEVVQIAFPTRTVVVKRCPSDEQPEGSNDCGIFALQNLFQFVGITANVDRASLKDYVW